MNKKKWLGVFFTIFIIPVIAIGVFNFIIDPMNIFMHSNKFNNMRYYFDERKIKTLFLSHHKEDYNGLLLGSSRVTYYNPYDIDKLKIFNYSVSNGNPYEYKYFIDYFKKKNNLDYLIMGIDFLDVTFIKKHTYETEISKNKKMFDEIDNSSTLELFANNYLNIDMTKQSLKNLKRYITNRTEHRAYNRNNFVLTDKVAEKKVKELAEERSQTYYDRYIGYDENFTNILKEVKNQNKSAKILVFTPPLSKPFLDAIMANKTLKKYYYKWINDLVDVFGTIYFTTFYSDISRNYQRFSKDGDHYYPFVGTEILKFIFNENLSKHKVNIIDNIIIIDKNNKNAVIGMLKQNTE